MITYLTLFTASDQSNAASLEPIFSVLRKNTPSEPGCISYEIYGDSTNPLVSCIIETWESQKSFEGHLEVVATNQYVEQALAFTAEPFKSIQLIEKFNLIK
ncbi:putative quinol monooxygenase [Pedobacter cryoconitis]|uniref:putative quinol monooxygenase n=1 Tax=Pedobacter cryoconitis TaxID=188932 RepID=UPI0016177578|nr:antibiotic biosynthesis monooxygenase [Pedobacter cryoconitis]MBB5645054.1 quinol monooxygenase YgiN [Pedobacter cryoconitis]